MPIQLDDKVNEGSTIGIQVSLIDENGVAIPQVNITSIHWSLSDPSGNIIDGLEDQEVLTPDSVNVVVLKGSNLQIVDSQNDEEERHFEVTSIVDTSLGTDLPITESAVFDVVNLKTKEV